MISNGEKKLWQSVLLVAINDAQSNLKCKYEVQQKEQAIQWLLHDTRDFYRVCSMADINPEAVRAKVRNMFAKNIQLTNLQSFGLNTSILIKSKITINLTVE